MLRRLIVLFLLIVFVMVVMPLVSTTWWNESWEYKKPINVSVSSGYTGLNYQILLNVTYDSDMNTSFKDLRFVNSTENGELDYWIESKVDSNYANVWVEVSENITTTNLTIYMYYGNPAVSTTSNATAVFEVFDDFNDNNYDGWTVSSGTWGVLDGVLNETSTGSGQYGHIYKDDYNNTLNSWKIFTDIKFDATGRYAGVVWDVQVKDEVGTYYAGLLIDLNDQIWIFQRSGGSWLNQNSSACTLAAGTWYTTKIIDDGLDKKHTVGNCEVIYQNDTLIYGEFGFRASDFVVTYYDNVKIAKYHDPEPVSYFGPEEEPPPVDTCTCAGLNTNWEIAMSDYCNITTVCDLGTGTLSFTGAGWCNCNASVDTTNLGDPGASGILYIQDSCLITID